jgi:hypothetical protein
MTLFRIPDAIVAALERCPTLGRQARLKSPEWWQAEIRANAGVDFAQELLKAEAWLRSNPRRAPRKDFARFVHAWLARAERDGDDG